MCTITFSYDDKDVVARQQLLALLSTGLFVKVDTHSDIDYSDAALYEVDQTASFPNEDLTPEELEQLIVKDIQSIYELKDAV